MKKVILGFLFSGIGTLVFADGITPPTQPSPITSVSEQFNMAFLGHISAVDSFRQDGSHVIKFADGIVQAIPYKGDHLLIGSFGLIPNPEDSTKFYKSYSLHAHLLGFFGQFVDVNPTYAVVLKDLELTPGYTYDTDLGHGGFDFSIGYSHQFGQ